MKTIAVLIVAIGIIVSGCDGPYGDPVTTIKGTILDAASGAPIDSAMVQIHDTVDTDIYYSDSLGHYMIGDMGHGTWRIWARKDGYEAAWIDVTSTENGSTVKGADIELALKEE